MFRGKHEASGLRVLFQSGGEFFGEGFLELEELVVFFLNCEAAAAAGGGGGVGGRRRKGWERVS